MTEVQKTQMEVDALVKVLEKLPVLTQLVIEDIPLDSGLFPWYERMAWKFRLNNSDRHVVVTIGGRSERRGDPCYLSHISWRKDDEIYFNTFQADQTDDAAAANARIEAWFSLVKPRETVYEQAEVATDRVETDCVITKGPDRIQFACRACGCEFNVPANKCKLSTSTGSGAKSGGRTYVWHTYYCPCCGAKCTHEYHHGK